MASWSTVAPRRKPNCSWAWPLVPEPMPSPFCAPAAPSPTAPRAPGDSPASFAAAPIPTTGASAARAERRVSFGTAEIMARLKRWYRRSNKCVIGCGSMATASRAQPTGEGGEHGKQARDDHLHRRPGLRAGRGDHGQRRPADLSPRGRGGCRRGDGRRDDRGPWSRGSPPFLTSDTPSMPPLAGNGRPRLRGRALV